MTDIEIVLVFLIVIYMLIGQVYLDKTDTPPPILGTTGIALFITIIASSIAMILWPAWIKLWEKMNDES